MRALLLAMAALAVALPTTPAQAEGGTSFGFVSGGSGFNGGVDRHDRRRHRGGDGDIFLGDWEYTGHAVWQSDGFNDWWHDRPDRAYPAWVRNNQKCERKWWAGSELRC